MQAIQTKYCGPTNFRGSRIRVWAEAGSMYVSYDHALSSENNHRAAIREYIQRWGWFGRWVIGATDRGYVATCAVRERRATVDGRMVSVAAAARTLDAALDEMPRAAVRKRLLGITPHELDVRRDAARDLIESSSVLDVTSEGT